MLKPCPHHSHGEPHSYTAELEPCLKCRLAGCLPAPAQAPKPAATVRATCPTCGEVYRSSPLKGDAHSQNAELKASREAQAHAWRTGHSVYVRRWYGDTAGGLHLTFDARR